jgi:hypothetical protein
MVKSNSNNQINVVVGRDVIMQVVYVLGVKRSFLFLFLLASARLLPGQILVLDVLDRVVELNELLFLK